MLTRTHGGKVTASNCTARTKQLAMVQDCKTRPLQRRSGGEGEVKRGLLISVFDLRSGHAAASAQFS